MTPDPLIGHLLPGSSRLIAMNAHQSALDRLIRLFGHPRLPLYAALVAVLLALPGLFIGWQLDDHFHRRFMTQSDQIGLHPLSVFSSLSGDSASMHHLVDVGILPWWTASDFRLGFCRYLSAATMMLDYSLWPDFPILMHLHSLAWYGALVLFAALLFRRLMRRPWVAGLAALLFAFDEAHAVPASWLANRNGLIACAFSLAALWAHDRWRQDGWRPGAIFSPLLFLAGLFSGEMAVSCLSFFAAYAAVLDSGSWRRRLLSLAPVASTFVIWAAIYRLLGLGAQGSGFYLDPLRQPLGYAAAFVERIPILLMGQWTPIPAELGMLYPPDAMFGLWAAGMGVLIVVVALLWPLIRTERTARFFALGTVGAFIPIAAVEPSNRLLFFVGFGSMALLALLCAAFFERDPALPASRLWRRFAASTLAVMALFHLVIAPVLKPSMAYSTKPMAEAASRIADSVPADSAIASQDLVIVNAPDYLFGVSSILTLQALNGKPVPRSLRGLVCGPTPLEIRRPDLRTLRMLAADGIFRGTLGHLFRPRSDGYMPGQSTHLTGVVITVLDTNEEGEPTEVDFRFDVPLEDASLRWLMYRDDRYVPCAPPQIGDTLRLPPSFGSLDLFWR